MNEKIKKYAFFRFLDEIIMRYNLNKISYTSGSMAYFFTLSFFPFIMFLNALIGLLDLDSVQLFNIMTPFFPEQVSNIIVGYNEYIANISNKPVLIISIIISLYSASRAIGSMIISLNSIYDIEKQRFFIVDWIISCIFTVAIGVVILLLAVSIITSTKVMGKIYEVLSISAPSVALTNIIVTLLTLIIIFFIIFSLYYIMPNKKMQAKKLIPGSIFSTFGIAMMGVFVSGYVRLSTRFSLLYGSISTIIVVMLWFYLFGNIISIGATINRTIECRKYTKEE